MNYVEQIPGWLKSLKELGLYDSQEEAYEYGVRLFECCARKRFHPSSINRFLEQLFCFSEDCNSSSLPFNVGNKKCGVIKGLDKIHE